MGLFKDRDLVIVKLQQMQEWLLIAYAISLPLSMTLSWALLTAGIIAWVVESGIRHFVKVPHDHGPMVSTPLPLRVQVWLLVLAVALSGAPHTEAWNSVWSLKGMLIYFWASKVFHFRPAIARQALPVLLLISGVAGVWGVIQYFFHLHWYYEQGTGFLSGPMAFAGQMQLFSTMALSLFLLKGHQRFGRVFENKWAWGGLVIANLLGLFACDERSAWLGGLAGILIITAMHSWKTLLKSMVAVCLVGAVSYYSVPMVHNRVDATINYKADVSTNSRFNMWKTAFVLWRDHPYFGAGWLKFPRIKDDKAIVPGKSVDLNHAHSNYLQFLGTTGIFGEIAYLWLLAGIVLVSIKSYVRAKVEKDSVAASVYAGALAGMVSLMVSGLFEFNFGTAQVRLAQWFILALLSYEAIKAPNQEKGTGPKDTVPDSLPSV